MKVKTQLCPRCNKMRRNQSPVAYVWWHVMGVGLMCWHCWARFSRSKEWRAR